MFDILGTRPQRRAGEVARMMRTRRGLFALCAVAVAATGVVGASRVGASDPSAAPVVVEAIDAGSGYTCAVRSNGTVACWGANLYGRLGDGTEVDRSSPTPVAGLTNVAQIGTGSTHTCALIIDGTVWCWGNNAVGQLGSGSFSSTNRLVPGPVPGLTDDRPISRRCDDATSVRAS